MFIHYNDVILLSHQIESQLGPATKKLMTTSVTKPQVALMHKHAYTYLHSSQEG